MLVRRVVFDWMVGEVLVGKLKCVVVIGSILSLGLSMIMLFLFFESGCKVKMFLCGVGNVIYLCLWVCIRFLGVKLMVICLFFKYYDYCFGYGIGFW